MSFWLYSLYEFYRDSQELLKDLYRYTKTLILIFEERIQEFFFKSS